MTREEQIRAAATAYTKGRCPMVISGSRFKDKMNSINANFIAGAEWADANQPNPWISVEERLPPQKDKDHPYSERVFVRYIERLGDQEYVRHSFDELLCIGKIKKWCRHQNNNEHVTHWMPIPELPKEGEEL